MRRRLPPLTIVPLAALLAAATFASPARAGNEAAAEALFGEAKKLAAQGKYAEACPKFAESNRLDRGAGTMIHLGDCYEKNKQLASAWATYKEAASAAQAQNRKDWEKLALQRATALEPKLAHLVIRVEGAVEKLEVTHDGTTVASPSWGVPLPVDTGEHKVEAQAPGHKPFQAVARVSKDGENVEVKVPPLEPEPVAQAPDAAPPPAESAPKPAAAKASSDGSGQRTVGFLVAGIGVAGIAAGAIAGLMAMGKASDAKDICPADGGCANRDAVDASESAKTFGLVSTIAFAAGGAALVGGAVLILTAPKASKEAGPAPATASLRVSPKAGPNGGGLFLQGVF